MYLSTVYISGLKKNRGGTDTSTDWFSVMFRDKDALSLASLVSIRRSFKLEAMSLTYVVMCV